MTPNCIICSEFHITYLSVPEYTQKGFLVVKLDNRFCCCHQIQLKWEGIILFYWKNIHDLGWFLYKYSLFIRNLSQNKDVGFNWRSNICNIGSNSTTCCQAIVLVTVFFFMLFIFLIHHYSPRVENWRMKVESLMTKSSKVRNRECLKWRTKSWWLCILLLFCHLVLTYLQNMKLG